MRRPSSPGNGGLGRPGSKRPILTQSTMRGAPAFGSVISLRFLRARRSGAAIPTTPPAATLRDHRSHVKPNSAAPNEPQPATSHRFLWNALRFFRAAVAGLAPSGVDTELRGDPRLVRRAAGRGDPTGPNPRSADDAD